MVQNIRQKLTETIVHQAEKAAYFCAAGNISSNQKVHELRRGFKRLRALLGFFREMPDHNAVQQQKEIRNFGKLLASLRESAV
ncbi:MAG: CHAD domain-containing protein, partial [Mariniphaga sp.]|nr:CHAD domain-containing protein [Mariniphaga sp.]